MKDSCRNRPTLKLLDRPLQCLAPTKYQIILPLCFQVQILEESLTQTLKMVALRHDDIQVRVQNKRNLTGDLQSDQIGRLRPIRGQVTANVLVKAKCIQYEMRKDLPPLFSTHELKIIKDGEGVEQFLDLTVFIDIRPVPNQRRETELQEFRAQLFLRSAAVPVESEDACKLGS